MSSKDGRLRTGDHILEIGGTNVQGMSSEQVAQVLRNCGNCVKMVVARDPMCEITVIPPTPAAQPVVASAFFQDRQLDTVSILKLCSSSPIAQLNVCIHSIIIRLMHS